MTPSESDKPKREYVWVPEDHVFESAPDCLGKFPNAGPACMLPTPSAYDELRAELAAATDGLRMKRDNRQLRQQNEVFKALAERRNEQLFLAYKQVDELNAENKNLKTKLRESVELLRRVDKFFDETNQ